MTMVKFVYFDVGGVVVKDFSETDNWTKLQKAIGLNQDQQKLFNKFWDKYPDIATNRDVESLKPLIEKEFNVSFPNNYSLLVDGFIKRFKRNESILPVIEIIHKNSDMGLLTNMYIGMFDEIGKYNLLPKTKWDIVIDSSKVNLRKPEIEIYQLAEKKTGFKGKEILFIENQKENIEAAKKLGWQTFFYDSVDYPKSSDELMKYYLKNK